MRRGFYLKLAADNIKKNSKVYVPFLIAGMCTVMVTYIMSALTQNSGLSQMRGGAEMQAILMLGTAVIWLFDVIFLFYTNSFLMKRRKKEFGVFNILGMEKKHIAKVIFYETFYIAFISIAVGLLAGVLMNKLCVLFVLRLMHTDVVLGFEISRSAMVITALIFGAVFLLILLNNIRQVHLTNPIELLKGGNVGEKEPKTKWVLAILGCICLGAGYYLAITTEDPISAMLLFFVAVVLVMAGTYLLFAAGSIAFLKIMRNRKRYYYQPKHFISVSGMIYRMKQNAIGLANICILSTGVLLLVAITVSMYAGTNSAIKSFYPSSLMMTTDGYSEADMEQLNRIAQDSAKEYGVELASVNAYERLSFTAQNTKEGFVANYPNGTPDAMENMTAFYFFTADGFKEITDSKVQLGENEVLIASEGVDYGKDHLRILDCDFNVQRELSEDEMQGLFGESATVVFDKCFVVVDSLNTLEKLQAKEAAAHGENASFIQGHFDINTAKDTDPDTELAWSDMVKSRALAETGVLYIESRAEGSKGVWGLYSGFLFLGILLGLLFVMATVLIIYYKQISEGYEDRERYEIMQKVGMSRKEVKDSIRSQILTVFFLPLVTAGIHMIVAFPMIKRLLALLLPTNSTLFVFCCIGSFIVFALCYAGIYSLTARAYYKIVSSKAN